CLILPSPRLRFLEVFISDYLEGDEVLVPLKWVAHALRALVCAPEKSELEQLTLGIIIRYGWSGVSNNIQLGWSIWAELDNILTTGDTFHKLPRLTIVIRQRRSLADDINLMPILQSLPRLVSLGKLHVTFEMDGSSLKFR
ncbi:hypothetical protein DXG03_001235, partial [Asterophora parasitica]